MPISKFKIEKREVTVFRDIPVLRVTLSPLEVCDAVRDYVRKTEFKRLSLGERRDIETNIEMTIDKRTNEFKGCKIEVCFEPEN